MYKLRKSYRHHSYLGSFGYKELKETGILCPFSVTVSSLPILGVFRHAPPSVHFVLPNTRTVGTQTDPNFAYVISNYIKVDVSEQEDGTGLETPTDTTSPKSPPGVGGASASHVSAAEKDN